MTRYFPPQVTLRALLLLLLVALLPVPTVADTNSPPIKVATTIGMVADLVKQVGGERVVVDTLMGPGVDPHLYKPTAHDASRLASADVIFYSGLMLEGRMGDLFERLSSAGKKTYATSDSVDRSLLQQPAQFQGHYDPHIWFDVSMWAQTVPTIVKGLSEADPASKATFEKNGAALQAKLKEIHEWCRKKAEELPREKRILVTSHDAYNYFGRAYGFKVVGLQGVSTVSEAGLADMTALVDLIQKEKVKAIFVESSVNPAAIRRVAKDAGVSVGGELFSDAMGAPGAMREGFDTGTYEGMVKHNLTIIVEALR